MGKDQEPIVSVHLAPREMQILHLAGTGLTNGDIARKLGISRGTVKNALFQALDKLEQGGIISSLDRGIGISGGRGTVSLAAKLAAEHGVIPPLPIDAKDALDFAQRVALHSFGR